MRALATFERGFLAANRWALIGLLAAMTVIIFTNVALRYLTNASLEWAEEVARHMMIWLTCLGAGPVLRAGGHIAVDTLPQALPKPLARALRAVVATLLFGFFGFMVWYGWLYMQRTMFQMTAVTQVPFAYIYAALPIGGLVLIVHWLLAVRDYVLEGAFQADGDGIDANAAAAI